MADLPYIQEAQEVKITGQDSTGNTVNYVSADANGNLLVKDYSDGPVTAGTVASASSLIGGQFNTALPTLTNTQQAAIQLDSSGRQIISQATASALNAQVVGNIASGSSDSGNPIKFGAVFNATLPTVTTGQRVDSQADSNGRNIVTNVPLDGSKATYSSSIAGLTTATTATDIFTISGSASKTIRITRLGFTLTTTSGSGISLNISLIKRSALDTGGTSTTQTNVPHDSNSAAGTAVVKAYTANPTALGATVGSIRNIRYSVAASNTIDLIEWTFGNRPAQAIVLRGTAENLVINFNSTTVTGGTISIDIEWTEE